MRDCATPNSVRLSLSERYPVGMSRSHQDRSPGNESRQVQQDNSGQQTEGQTVSETPGASERGPVEPRLKEWGLSRKAAGLAHMQRKYPRLAEPGFEDDPGQGHARLPMRPPPSKNRFGLWYDFRNGHPHRTAPHHTSPDCPPNGRGGGGRVLRWLRGAPHHTVSPARQMMPRYRLLCVKRQIRFDLRGPNRVRC
jgi:hypothetical protein